MMKANIFKLFLMITCILFLTSCVTRITNEVENDENQVVDTFEEFKEVVSKEPENVTYQMNVITTAFIGNTSETQEVDITVKLDDNRTLIEGKLYEDEGMAYAEFVDGKYYAWSYVNNRWVSDGIISSEQYQDSTQYPLIEVNEGDFEYKDGLWVANTENIESELLKALGESIVGDGNNVDIDIENYIITIEEDHIAKMEMEFSMNLSSGGYSVGFEFSYEIIFEDYGNTEVERPKNLPTQK